MILRYIKTKYVTSEAVHYQLKHIRPERGISSRFYSLSLEGLLIIQEGYGWDGPSGPTFDTPTVMFNSLIHDVLYEMFRKDQLDISWRSEADRELKAIGIACGANPNRMKVWQTMVEIFAEGSTLPKNEKIIYEVPAVEEA